MAPDLPWQIVSARIWTRYHRVLVPLLGILSVGMAAAAIKGPAWFGVHNATAKDADNEAGERNAVKLKSDTIVETAGIEVAPVELHSIADMLACNGNTGFNQNHYALVRPRVDGIVREVRVDVGAEVTAGELLAIVDSASLGDHKAAYLIALAKLEHFQEHYDRAQRLVEQHVMPAKDLFEAEHRFEQAQTTAARTRQQLVNLGFSTRQIEDLAADKNSSTELAVAAPWDGVIVQRQAVEGEAVEHSQTLFAVADLSTMWVHLNAYESDLARLRLGQQVTFVAEGLPDREFSGKIDWISAEIEPQSRTLQVRAEIANPDAVLRANMFGKGCIQLEAVRQCLAVPPAAVQWHDNNQIVFVQAPDREYLARRVTLGVKSGDFWEVTSGLHQGESVVTTGSFLLKSELEKGSIPGDD